MSNPIFNAFFSNNKQSFTPQNMIMNMVKQNNPQVFNQIQTLMQNGVNPEQYARNQIANASPQQVEQVKQVARQFGINEQQIHQIDDIRKQ